MEKPWTGSHGNLWKDEQEFWVPQVTKEGGGGGEAYAEAPSVVGSISGSKKRHAIEFGPSGSDRARAGSWLM